MVNVQIPVVLWTVICFLLLMLILQKLLFEPMFRCMDAREKKIADAQEKRRKNEEILTEASETMERSVREQNEQAKKEAERIIAEEQIQADHSLDEKQSEEKEILARYGETLCAEREELLRQAAQETETLAEAFVAGFVS